MKLFTPNEYVKDFTCIDLAQLQKKGIKMIICDVDNTLVAHDEKVPSAAVHAFKEEVLKRGFLFCLISNNVNERVSIFAKELQVDYYPNAKKPLSATYQKIINDYGIDPCFISAVGDQLLTDVWGGNRMNMYTILTHPLYTKDLVWTKFNRFIEQQVFKKLEKQGLLKKGDFNE